MVRRETRSPGWSWNGAGGAGSVPAGSGTASTAKPESSPGRVGAGARWAPHASSSAPHASSDTGAEGRTMRRGDMDGPRRKKHTTIRMASPMQTTRDMTTPGETVSTLTLSPRAWEKAGLQVLHRQARRAFAEGATTLVLDAGDGQPLDARAIKGLVRLVAQAPTGARVVLVGLGPEARRLARVTCLDEILDIHESHGEAMALAAG